MVVDSPPPSTLVNAIVRASPLGALDFALACATQRDLEESIGDGRLRPDLYHRIPLHGGRMRALREHPERASPHPACARGWP